MDRRAVIAAAAIAMAAGPVFAQATIAQTRGLLPLLGGLKRPMPRKPRRLEPLA
jgi:hypothetical protein